MMIASVPVAGGSTNVLATVATDPMDCPSGGCSGAVTTDGRFVYFTSDASNGLVRKVPVTGGPPIMIADHQARPLGIAVDAACVYWASLTEGTVMIAPK